MKKPFKKLLTLALVITVGVSLSACGSSEYNTEAPYGKITGNYATNNGHELTNKQLYDLLRPSGYNVFYNELEEILLTNYVNDDGTSINYLSLDYTDDYDAMHEIILEKIFSTDDYNDVLDLTPSAFEDSIEQLIDTLYISNLSLTTDDIKRNPTKLYFSESLFDYFKLELAKENYANDRLKEVIAKGETYEKEVKDEDGEVVLDNDGNPKTETIDNTYYIDDKDIENYYNSTYRQSLDYNAIIVGFNTIAEYEVAVTEANSYNGFSTNTNSFYAKLYNNAYTYKESFSVTSANMTAESLIGNTSIVNADKLSSFNTDLASFVYNMEAGESTSSYKEFGEKYYMVYKLTDSTSDKWEDLSDEKQDLMYDDIYNEIFDSKITSTFISEQLNEIISDLVDEDAFKIYDPIFGLNFASNFSSFTYDALTLESTDNVLTMKYNDKDYNITPEDLFNELAKYFGVSASVSYFTNNAIANSELVNNLDDDALDLAQDAFDAELARFKNNEFAAQGVTNQFDEEQFLSMMFGYDNETDVVDNYFISQQVISYLSEDYSDLYFDLLELTGQNNYNNYFNLNVKHVLLYVDYDLDGTLDNPEEFMMKLAREDNGTAKVAAFEETILSIYKHIEEEVDYLSGSYSDNLDKIVRMYNDGSTIAYTTQTSATTTTWSNVQTKEGYDFNIQIKVEELGTIDNASASSYVTEFSEHVESMYRKLYNENKTIYDDENNITTDSTLDNDYTKNLLKSLTEYLSEEHLEEISTFDKLCMSSFGFHMLLSTDGSVSSNATFTKDNDTKPEVDADKFTYEDVVVMYKDEEYVLSGYSNNPWPSKDQLQIYVFESDSDDGVENLKSETEIIISEFYSTFTSRYNDTGFINYLFYNMLEMDIQFAHSSVIDKVNMITNYFEINKKVIDEYKDTSSESTSMYAGWWELIEGYDWTSNK